MMGGPPKKSCKDDIIDGDIKEQELLSSLLDVPGVQ